MLWLLVVNGILTNLKVKRIEAVRNLGRYSTVLPDRYDRKVNKVTFHNEISVNTDVMECGSI